MDFGKKLYEEKKAKAAAKKKQTTVQVKEVKAFTNMSAEYIAFEALLQCETNQIPVKEFMIALKEQLEMLDQTQAVA